MPPQAPLACPNPKAARVEQAGVGHLKVRPGGHRSQVRQETDQGTRTRVPGPNSRTPDPTSRISATHSWPIAKGPWKGTLPQMVPTTGSMTPRAIPACMARETGRWMGRVSPSQRPATNGRTIASVGSSSVGAGRSPHSNTPERRKRGSRTDWDAAVDEGRSGGHVEQKDMNTSKPACIRAAWPREPNWPNTG